MRVPMRWKLFQHLLYVVHVRFLIVHGRADTGG